MGNVCQGFLGQAPARQAALFAGLENVYFPFTINILHLINVYNNNNHNDEVALCWNIDKNI